jgi:hypothetical protein
VYFELLKVNELDPDKPLAVFIQPAWILKPPARHKVPDHVLEVTEDDIEELTIPSRWSYRDLMKEARKNVTAFLTQNLCMYIESEDAKTKIQFEEHVLRANVRLPGFFENPKFKLVETILGVDVAYSTSRYADYSAIACIKVYQGPDERYFAVIADVTMGRFKTSELGLEIVRAQIRHNPGKIIIERAGNYEVLGAEIDNNCMRHGIAKMYNIFWKPTTGGNSVKNKVARVKSLETLLNAGQLFLINGSFTESLIQQFVRFDGVKRSGSSDGSKDDGPDACSLAIEGCHYIRRIGEQPSEAQIEMEQEMAHQQLRQAQYHRVFGGRTDYDRPAPYPQLQPPEEQPGPLYSQLQRFGMTRKAA